MDYMPRVGKMNRIAGAPLGREHTVILFDEIESIGHVQYEYLVAVFENKTQQPIYFIASEVNATSKDFNEGTHYLGIFDGHGHINRGSSDAWGDPKKFFPEALRIANEMFGTEQPKT